MYRSSIHLVKVPSNPCYYLEFSPHKKNPQVARADRGELSFSKAQTELDIKQETVQTTLFYHLNLNFIEKAVGIFSMYYFFYNKFIFNYLFQIVITRVT